MTLSRISTRADVAARRHTRDVRPADIRRTHTLSHSTTAYWDIALRDSGSAHWLSGDVRRFRTTGRLSPIAASSP